MITALGYQCEVPAETPLRHSQRVLVLTMSISNYLSSDCASEHSALQRPAVTFNVNQYPQSIALLLLPPSDRERSKWQGTAQVLVNSV